MDEWITDPDLMLNTSVDVLDVRPMLEQGEEPFGPIKEALESLPDSRSLAIIPNFDPRPLKKFVEQQGFQYDYQHLGEDVHLLVVWHGEPGKITRTDGPGPSLVLPGAKGQIIILDGRKLGPPKPLEWTSEHLASMSDGDLLVQHNDRRPQLLLENLEGFEWDVEELSSDHVRVEFRVSD